MRFSSTTTLASLAAIHLSVLTTAQEVDISYPPNSPRRGLAYVEPEENPADDKFWINSSLTWYYNWENRPSSQLSSSSLQFVPMLWGAGGSENFYSTIASLRSNRPDLNISHVLGFNEPDGCTGVEGGSCLDAETAAQIWIQQMEPLKEEFGIKLGAPAVTSAPTGFNWLQNFFTACAGQCTPDFLPVHYYGDFPGFASHVGQVNATYMNMTMWVTEWGYPDASLAETQSFFNESMAFLDRVPYIERYSIFGAFRSSVSNIGPNAALLTQKGELTDLGAWYLGQEATGNIPERGDATRMAGFVGWLGVVAATGFWCLG